MESEIRVNAVLEGRGEVTICASERRNSLNSTLIEELVSTVEALAQDPSCRVVVIRGEGSHFCAGWDVKDFARLSALRAAQIEQELQASHEAFQRLRAVPAITLGVVRGAVVGAGVGLLRALHVVVASETLRVSLPEIKYGIVPAGVMVDLLDLPPAVALDLLVTGEAMSGRRAYDLGVVSRVVGDDQLDAEADRLATLIASHSESAVRSLLKTYQVITPRQSMSARIRAYEASAKSVAAMMKNTQASSAAT